ncbi:MAG: alpha/beta hydrolase [Verrucomicrobia bacterium]|nr:alpha/beta hydrolase [Verrucomicrobiota bacterium]
MRRVLLPLLFCAAAAAAEPSRLPRENLLVRHDTSGAAAPVRDVTEWSQRRAEIVRGMEAIMGPLPAPKVRAALDVRVEEEVDCGTYVRRKISYQSEPGSRVPAYLCIPKAALAADATKDRRKFPGVLCPHPTDNSIGCGVVVGLSPKPNRAYASELATRGFVTIAPNYPHLASYAPDLKALGYASGTMKAIWDNIRALDLLESLPFVRPGRFATIGHSLGGHNSVFTAVFEPRLVAVVTSCGLDSFLDYYGGDSKVWLPGKGWCQERYMPWLAGYAGRLAEIPFDFHELIGALAPRPVFINAPLRDANFKWQSVDRVAAAARAIYQLHGAADRLRVEHPDSEHDFPDAMREIAYARIAEALK